MKKRNAFKMMFDLLKLIHSLIMTMCLAIFFGVLGHASAILIPVLGVSMLVFPDHQKSILIVLVASALLRGIFRYIEQALNHELAFRVLAQLRDKIFSKMRELAPAILDGKDRGNLISLITGDIEHLEVFFAHTISPIFIALIINTTVVIVMFNINLYFGFISLLSYILVGIIFPIVFSSKVREMGFEFRNNLGEINSSILESVMGIKDVLQFNHQDKSIDKLDKMSKTLNSSQKDMNAYTILNSHAVEMVVFISNISIVILGFSMNLPTDQIILGSTLHTSSFGPVIALANLANNMYHVLAAGDRVLNLLEEVNETQDIKDGNNLDTIKNVSIQDLSFAYDEKEVIKHANLDVNEDAIVGIQGASGSGKSTLLKLLMRYYTVKNGSINLNDMNIESINSEDLKMNQAYMSQHTDLFQMSIGDNIRLGKENASEEELIEASKKAGIHEFIMTLPKGYDTDVLEFGSSLSSGEKQRLSLARLFLKDAPLMVLDEPSSNLDSLNEAILLKSLHKHKENKTIIITSHRASTLGIATETWQVDKGVFKKSIS